MSTENTPDTAELERLREHNKQLLSELKAERAANKAAQDGLQAAQAAEKHWRERWYSLEVSAPLEADLRGAAAGPWKYLRDTCTELGLLKMEPDSEGIERPAWYDENGKPADVSSGVYKFLSAVHARIGGDLGHCLRSTGTSGSGAQGGASHPPTPSAPETPKGATPSVTLGLR